jgi:hypothetical protein
VTTSAPAPPTREPGAPAAPSGSGRLRRLRFPLVVALAVGTAAALAAIAGGGACSTCGRWTPAAAYASDSSSVSACRSAAVRLSSLSRFSVSTRVTVTCASSTIRRTSSSISWRIASETSDAPGSSGPCASDGITAIGPIALLIPQRPTIWRAICVSCWMSDSAPAEIEP